VLLVTVVSAGASARTTNKTEPVVLALALPSALVATTIRMQGKERQL
jgi:hypothetical protein